MNERDKTLLIYLGAALILAAAYFFGARPLMDKIDVLATEKESLNEEIRLRQEALENSKNYQAKIDECKKEYDSILTKYPADVIDERSLLFISNIEDFMPGAWFTEVKFATKEEAMVQAEDNGSAGASEAEQTEIEEVESTEENQGGEATTETTEVEQGSVSQTSLAGLYGIECELGLAYEMPYSIYKQFIDYLNKYPEKITIKEIDSEYDPELMAIKGTAKLSQFAISGPGRTIGTPECEEVFLGTNNIFYSGLSADALPDGSEAANAIGSDVFVKLNGITDNTPNGITVGMSTDTSNETYIASTKNSSQAVKIKITGKAGQYEVKYSIGKTSQTCNLEKNDDSIAIFVMCDDRLEDDDVGAELYITNDSDKSVVVNVQNDDSDNPRVDVKEATGDVEIN